MPVAQRLRWGRTQFDPLLLGEATQKYKQWAFHTPQNTNGGAPSLPYPTTQLKLRSTKPNYGQLNPKGPTWGVFLNPPFWAHG